MTTRLNNIILTLNLTISWLFISHCSFISHNAALCLTISTLYLTQLISQISVVTIYHPNILNFEHISRNCNWILWCDFLSWNCDFILQWHLISRSCNFTPHNMSSYIPIVNLFLLILTLNITMWFCVSHLQLHITYVFIFHNGDCVSHKCNFILRIVTLFLSLNLISQQPFVFSTLRLKKASILCCPNLNVNSTRKLLKC